MDCACVNGPHFPLDADGWHFGGDWSLLTTRGRTMMVEPAIAEYVAPRYAKQLSSARL
jgi:hypothetical protein